MNMEWTEDIDEEKLEKAAEFGEIPPRLPLPDIGEIVTVKFLDEPKKIEAEAIPGGSMFVAEVEHAGQKYQMIAPKSLRFQLARAMKVHNVELVGSIFQIGATKGNVMGIIGAKVYFASLVEREPEYTREEEL